MKIWKSGVQSLSGILGALALMSQAFLASGCSSQDGTFLHVLYRMNIGIGPVMPCLGLYNDATGQLVPPVVCEKDVRLTGPELRVEANPPGSPSASSQVLDATIRTGNFETVWPGVDGSPHSLRPFIYFPDDDLLYTTAQYSFNPYTSPEGENGKTLEANFTYSEKVLGQKPEFQSLPGTIVIR